MRLKRRTVWYNKARVPRTQYASLGSNYTTENSISELTDLPTNRFSLTVYDQDTVNKDSF